MNLPVAPSANNQLVTLPHRECFPATAITANGNASDSITHLKSHHVLNRLLPHSTDQGWASHQFLSRAMSAAEFRSSFTMGLTLPKEELAQINDPYARITATMSLPWGVFLRPTNIAKRGPEVQRYLIKPKDLAILEFSDAFGNAPLQDQGMLLLLHLVPLPKYQYHWPTASQTWRNLCNFPSIHLCLTRKA